MEALRKKMHSMREDTENAKKRAVEVEQKSRETSEAVDMNESKITQLQKGIQNKQDELDTVQDKLSGVEKKIDDKDKICQDAEEEINALHRRLQLLEEDISRATERLKTSVDELDEVSATGNSNEKNRVGLEKTSFNEEQRAYEMELQLEESKIIAIETDRKCDEIARKLAICEGDLQRTNAKGDEIEDQIIELEDELRLVGTNLKTLEVSAEKASQREEQYDKEVTKIEKKLAEAVHRAEYAERAVAKLQSEVDRLEEELIQETEDYKNTVSDLDATLSEITFR